MSAQVRMAILQQVQAGLAASTTTFSSLMRPNVVWHPVPYFGNPSTASIATVGVNPSSTEFTGSRWPAASLTAQQLDTRLTSYFTNPAIPPHAWFQGWEKALVHLGHSYRTTAVHLDLSPRATKSMGTADHKLFLQMVQNDMVWFLALLSGFANIKCVMIAGSVTKAYYMDEFLRRFLPLGYGLSRQHVFDERPRGATALYELSGPSFRKPVFFCGTSPSGDRGVRLQAEIEKHHALLKSGGF